MMSSKFKQPCINQNLKAKYCILEFPTILNYSCNQFERKNGVLRNFLNKQDACSTIIDACLGVHFIYALCALLFNSMLVYFLTSNYQY